MRNLNIQELALLRQNFLNIKPTLDFLHRGLSLVVAIAFNLLHSWGIMDNLEHIFHNQ